MVMSRFGPGYGRARNDNARNFIQELSKTQDSRKRAFEADQETLTAASPTKKFQTDKSLAIDTTADYRLQRTMPQQQSTRRNTSSPEGSPPPPQRRLAQLPTPSSDSSNTDSQTQLSARARRGKRHTKRILRQRKKRQNMEDSNGLNATQQRPLPSPPTSAREQNEASSESAQAESKNCESTRTPTQGSDDETGSTDPTNTTAGGSISLSAKGSSIEKFDHKIWKYVLTCVLQSKGAVKPFYKKGMMKNSLRSETDGDKGVIALENVDLSILRTCRAIHDVGTEAYYGTHQFRFSDPDACK